MFAHINDMAVVVTAILALAVGSIWYSPLLFGFQWMKAAGLQTHDLDEQRARMMTMLFMGLASHIGFFYALALVLEKAQTLGITILATIGTVLSLCGALLISMTVWEGKSLSYFAIHIGYAAIIILGGSAVITYWPW